MAKGSQNQTLNAIVFYIRRCWTGTSGISEFVFASHVSHYACNRWFTLRPAAQ